MRRRIASNVAWMLIERALQVAFGIGIVAMLARGLGPIGFAHFQYAQAVVTIAASVALICGAEVVVPRLVADTAPASRHRLLMHALLLRASGAALGYGLMCGYLWFMGTTAEVWTIALLLGIGILLREPSGVVIAWMQANTHNRPGTVISLLSLSAKFALVGGMIWLHVSNGPAYAGAFAVEAICLALLLALYYRSHVSEPYPAFEPELARSLFHSGAVLWVSFMLTMAARRVDQLILHPIAPAADFSAYAACIQILDNYTAVATILTAGIAPVYIYGRGPADAWRNVGRLALLIGGIGLAGAVVIAIAADLIVHLLYGAQYANAAALLRYAAFASTLIFVDVALTLLPVRMRKPGWIAGKWAGTLAVTAAVDLYAIPRHGTWGALAGYAIGNAFAVAIGIGIWLSQRHNATRAKTDPAPV